MRMDAAFYSMLGLLTFAVIFEGLVFLATQRRLQRGLPSSERAWVLTSIVDLSIPMSALWIHQTFAPEIEFTVVAAPALLGVPLVIMLSILRLRPGAAIFTGILAALMHWILVINVIRTERLGPHAWPVLFTYGEMLAFTGVVAAVITAQVRARVREAADEAVAAAAANRELATIDHDLAVARQIQQGLMPSGPPRFDGFDIAGMARPAAQTGGDYYDWQPLADGRLVVAIADVTGHGIGPALVMAVCRAYARASAPDAPDPGALLTRINRLVHDDLAGSGRFITMVIVMLSPDGAVEIVSAGHGPTLLRRAAGGEIECFGGDGPPLGIDADQTYGPSRRLRLDPGDLILLLTDGFMEWTRAQDGEQFGIQRLRQTVASHAHGGATDLLAALDAAVQGFASGSAQRDDTTAVAIRRSERSPPVGS